VRPVLVLWAVLGLLYPAAWCAVAWGHAVVFGGDLLRPLIAGLTGLVLVPALAARTGGTPAVEAFAAGAVGGFAVAGVVGWVVIAGDGRWPFELVAIVCAAVFAVGLASAVYRRRSVGRA